MGTATDKVIDQIIENRRKFEDFCFSLNDEELDRPVPESTWLVRDFAAHLATLDPGMAQLFEATVRNERMTTPEGGTFDVDAHNEPLVVARRTWTMAQVFEEGRTKRAALIELLRGITDEQTQHQMWFEADAKRGFGASPFSLQGALAKTPVAQVLGRLWRQHASGALLLRREAVGIAFIVWWIDGTCRECKFGRHCRRLHFRLLLGKIVR